MPSACALWPPTWSGPDEGSGGFRAYHQHVNAHSSVGRPALLAMVFATVVLGHELTYLLTHGFSGYDAAMAEAGHERYWVAFVLAVAATGCVLALVAVRQLLRLRNLAAGIEGGGTQNTGALRQLLAGLWRRTALGALLVYLLQENLEAVTSGQPLPGLNVLAGDQIVALPLVLLVALTIALIGALVAWRRDALLAQIQCGGVAPRRRAPRFARDSGIRVARKAYIGSANAVRAPPQRRPQLV